MPCQPAEIKNGKLLIGYAANDNAVTPVTRPIPDTAAYWVSPNIRLLNGIDDGTARVDPDPSKTPSHFIEVTVGNISTQPVQDVKIEVWVCDFTLGITPSSSLASSNPGGLPMEGFAAGPVNAAKSVPITCGPWKPTSADASVNGGHVCIAANCYLNDGTDGTPLSLRPAPFTNKFSMTCDTHHAQRNIAIVKQASLKMLFPMKLGNPLAGKEFEGVVEIKRTLSKTALVKATRGHLRSMPGVVYLKEGPRQLESMGGRLVMPQGLTIERAIDHGRFLLQLSENEYTPLFFSRYRPDFALDAEGHGTGQTVKVRLREGDVSPLAVQLQLDEGEDPGGINAFDLVQRDDSGMVVGAARLMVIRTP